MKVPIPAPPARPPRYGLVAVAGREDASLVTSYDGWKMARETCGGGGRLDATCYGNTATMTGTDAGALVDGDGFVVWAMDQCTATGFRVRDYSARARRALEAVQSHEIAAEVWGGSLGLAQQSLVGAASDTVNTTSDVTITDAIAQVDGALATLTKGRPGMIHMTVQALTHAVAADAVVRDGNLWRTGYGTVVVADSGYDGSGPDGTAASTFQWLYGSGMIDVRLGPVELIPGDVDNDPDAMRMALDRSVNKVTVFAVRPVTYVWDECGWVAARVGIPVPSIAGAS